MHQVIKYILSCFNVLKVIVHSELIQKVALLEKRLSSLTIDYNLSEYDIWTEKGRSQHEQQEFKERLINYYSRRGFFSNKIKCMVTDEWHPMNHVIASHIWKQRTHGAGLQVFLLERSDIISARNGLLLLKSIEERFDIKHLCIIYDPITSEFRVKVLNPNIMDNTIEFSTKTFRDIDGSKLQHPKKKYPFRRLLSFHARCAFKFARQSEWISADDEAQFEPYHALSENASVPDIDIDEIA
jgi:hypothetical protein